jgi:hypothetical protein
VRTVTWERGVMIVNETPRSEIKCSPRQGLIAMAQTPFEGYDNLLQAVDGLIYSSGAMALIISWERSTEWLRDDPRFDMIGAALQLTPEQIDQLFFRAMSI